MATTSLSCGPSATGNSNSAGTLELEPFIDEAANGGEQHGGRQAWLKLGKGILVAAFVLSAVASGAACAKSTNAVSARSSGVDMAAGLVSTDNEFFASVSRATAGLPWSTIAEAYKQITQGTPIATDPALRALQVFYTAALPATKQEILRHMRCAIHSASHPAALAAVTGTALAAPPVACVPPSDPGPLTTTTSTMGAITASTNVSDLTSDIISGELVVNNVEFANLGSNPTLAQEFEQTCQQSIATEADTNPSMVAVALSVGSVKIEYTILVHGNQRSSVASALTTSISPISSCGSSTLATRLVNSLSEISGIVTTGSLTVSGCTTPTIASFGGNAQTALIPIVTINTTTSTSTLFSPQRPTLTPAQQDQILNLHNNHRGSIGASDMMKMETILSLHIVAQEYADGLHGTACGDDSIPHFDTQEYGVNVKRTPLVGLSSNVNLFNQDVQEWYNVANAGSYQNGGTYTGTDSCPNPAACERYVQAVWKAADQLGCGATNCLDGGGYPGHILVCLYHTTFQAESGAPMIDRTIYTPGDACTDCPSGSACAGTSNDNLCTISG